MKQKAIVIIMMLLFSVTTTLRAQQNGLAILPFAAVNEADAGTAAYLQDLVLAIFSKRKDLLIIDRSKDTLLLRELDYQKRGVSIAAKELAEQGKVAGAKDIIFGTLNKVVAEKIISGNNKNNQILTSVQYTGMVFFSLQVVDAATGNIKKQFVFDGTTGKIDNARKLAEGIGRVWDKFKKIVDVPKTFQADTREAAIREAINGCVNYIKNASFDVYPPNLKLLSVESKKDDKPEKILVAGIDESFKPGMKILVNNIQVINGDNKQVYQREIPLARIKLLERQGEVAIFKVISGASELAPKIGNNNNLEFEIEK